MIHMPGFRKSQHDKAWVYASSRGRLLSNDMTVFQSKRLDAYEYTTITQSVQYALGQSQKIPVHRIIAYTFLGPPQDPSQTVDHVNRLRGDNRVINLRWADIHTR